MIAPTTRRGLFGGSAALLVIGAAGSGHQEPPDAELLATCAAFIEADDKRRQTDANLLDLPPDELDVLDTSWWDIMARLKDMEPVTAAGKAAKAKAAYRAAMYEATALRAVPWTEQAMPRAQFIIKALADAAGVDVDSGCPVLRPMRACA